MTPLKEWSAHHRDRYVETTRHTHNRRHIHAISGIRTRNPSNEAAANLRLRRKGHRDRPTVILTLILLTWRIWWAPNNASRWQMGFNSASKELIIKYMGLDSLDWIILAQDKLRAFVKAIMKFRFSWKVGNVMNSAVTTRFAAGSQSTDRVALWSKWMCNRQWQ